MTEPKKTNQKKTNQKKRKYVAQAMVPTWSLEEAMRIPQALADQYTKDPTNPLKIAQVLNMLPSSGGFRMLASASKAYGLTDGGAKAPTIGLTDLGRRAVAPVEEGDDLAALKEAAMQPTVQRSFYEKYDQSPLPSEHVALNVLEELGIPATATKRALQTILTNAEYLGFASDLKGKKYLDLSSVVVTPDGGDDDSEDVGLEDEDEGFVGRSTLEDEADRPVVQELEPSPPNRRVFVSHGSNKRIVSQLKDLLKYGEFEPVVSVEKETVSKPVSQKVFDDMRSCDAGIIHVSPEEALLDKQGNERFILNENVLIEIGAAMALYPNRFILLVEEGTRLPSNLSGLYEARYSGPELDYEGTMKVLKALNEFKSVK